MKSTTNDINFYMKTVCLCRQMKTVCEPHTILPTYFSSSGRSVHSQRLFLEARILYEEKHFIYQSTIAEKIVFKLQQKAMQLTDTDGF